MTKTIPINSGFDRRAMTATPVEEIAAELAVFAKVDWSADVVIDEHIEIYPFAVEAEEENKA